VTAVAQIGTDGYGPAYLVNGLEIKLLVSGWVSIRLGRQRVNGFQLAMKSSTLQETASSS